MIYLDNASTTKVFDSVINIMTDIFRNNFFNPSALYASAQNVRKMLENARMDIANYLGVEDSELYFTSCATESNNWVLKNGLKNKSGNIVISAGEHASIDATANELKAKGIEVRIAKLLPTGLVDSDDLISKIDDKTCLVSVMHCSNETGVKNDIKTLSNLAKNINPNILFHSDGVQALCKTRTRLDELGVDLYSASSHKIGGAKGTGFLFIRKGLHLASFIQGGGQEKGLRSGTENVAGIVGFSKAINEYSSNFSNEKMKSFKREIINNLTGSISDFTINGDQTNSNDCILSLSFKNVKAEILLNMLNDDGVLIGLGSACSSKKRSNKTLSQMGLNQSMIEGSIRLSFSTDTTMEDVALASKLLVKNILKMRGHTIG